eukprot:gene12827-14809_t
MWNGSESDADGHVTTRWVEGKEGVTTVDSPTEMAPFTAPVQNKEREQDKGQTEYPQTSSVKPAASSKTLQQDAPVSVVSAPPVKGASSEAILACAPANAPANKKGPVYVGERRSVPGRDGRVRGKVVYPDGSVCEGRWEAGKFVEGKNIHPDGTTFE